MRDIAAIRKFYVDILRFEIEREVPDRELWLTKGGDSLVFLCGEPANIDHFGLMVPEASDVALWETELRNQGVAIVESTERYDDGSVGMICRDPAGHALQLLWHPVACAHLARTEGQAAILDAEAPDVCSVTHSATPTSQQAGLWKIP